MVGGSSFLTDLEGHVRKGKVTALAVSAVVLAVGAVAAVAPAGSAATKATAAAPPTIAITPGVTHPMGVMATPSQANCVAYGFYHCLTPQQVETAYNLAALYRQGITGKGKTIVIVDSFGSPDDQARPRRSTSSSAPRAAVLQSSPRRARSRSSTRNNPT